MIGQLALNRVLYIHLRQFQPFGPGFADFGLDLDFLAKMLRECCFQFFTISHFQINNQFSRNFIGHLKIKIGNKIGQHLPQVITEHIWEITFSTQHFAVAHMHDLHTGHPGLIGNRQDIGFAFELIDRLLRLYVS